MIGKELQKLRSMILMRVDQGVGYGGLHQFQGTAYEGPGYKQINFATAIPTAAGRRRLVERLNSFDLEEEFWITNLTITSRTIEIVFRNKKGVMKRIDAFLDWFIRELDYSGATTLNICPECLRPVSEQRWLLIGDTAYQIHDDCADRICREMFGDVDWRGTDRFYLRGFAGAMLGAFLGAVLWTVLISILVRVFPLIHANAYYLVPMAGIIVGWLVSAGYRLLKGRQGQYRGLAVFLPIILGVALAILAPEIIGALETLAVGGEHGFGVRDAFALFGLRLQEWSFYRRWLVVDTILSWILAIFPARYILNVSRDKVPSFGIRELTKEL